MEHPQIFPGKPIIPDTDINTYYIYDISNDEYVSISKALVRSGALVLSIRKLRHLSQAFFPSNIRTLCHSKFVGYANCYGSIATRSRFL